MVQSIERMTNIQISSSTSTQSSEDMDERNDEPSIPIPPGDNRRPGRNEQQHASSDSLRKRAITGKYKAHFLWMMDISYCFALLPFKIPSNHS